MNREELEIVLREIERASSVNRKRVIHLIRSTVVSQHHGPIDELEMDAGTVPEEVYHIIFFILKRGIIPVNHQRLEREALSANRTQRQSIRIDEQSFASLYWFAYRQRQGGRDVLRSIRPSRETRRLLQLCRASGYTLLSNPPVYVRPSIHFGKNVGDGLFALAPFHRGQMIMQFTGTVHNLSSGKRFMLGRRQDYVINMRYMGRDFTLDPLDSATHQHVNPPHYAAYINEPSPPPFASMSNARHEPTGRNVLVHRYAYKTGLFRIEFPNRQMEDVEPETLSTEATRSLPLQQRLYRANCTWFDFPVPLNDLYTKVKVKDNGICVYKRTKMHACTVTFREAVELVTAFESHTNQAYSFEMHRLRVDKIVVGDVLTLRDERLDGLRRHGLVTRISSHGWEVHFRLKTETAWRLPRIVYAGASSARGYDVPFPIIYACSNIRTGDELLCLYDDTLSSRGTRCHTLLDDSEFGLPWYEYVE